MLTAHENGEDNLLVIASLGKMLLTRRVPSFYGNMGKCEIRGFPRRQDDNQVEMLSYS
jgi:hypothetical protein